MYCVGKVGTIYIRSAVEEMRDTKGQLVRAAQPPLRAVFQTGGTIPEHAKRKALAYLDFPGIPEHADPLAYVTWFDSKIAAHDNQWDAQDLEYVENFLRSRDGRDFIIVEQPVIEAPFPNWVKQTSVHGQRRIEHVVAAAVKFVEEMGLNVDAVILFEQQANRPESAAIIEALSPVTEPEPEELVAA